MKQNQISLLLPPDLRWLPLLEDGLRRYANTVGFPPTLENKISWAVMEACEELLRVGVEAGIATPYRVVLDFKGEVAIIEVEYNGAIPLNPFATAEYEMPGEAADIDELTTDGLWLHLIKQQMDRVFFSVRGGRKVLSMMEYRREDGAERRLWAMSIRPQLATGLQLHLKSEVGESSASVLQKFGGKVLMLGSSETFFVENMDGKRSFHDLYMAHVDKLGLVSPSLPTRLYEKLEATQMLANPDGEQPQRWWTSLYHRLLNPSFSVPHADALVSAVYRRVTFFFTPVGVTLLLLLGLSGFIPLWLKHEALFQTLAGLEQSFLAAPRMLIPLYAMTLLHVALHEFGHGVVCKHYGGKVPRLGVMFYLGSFIFFCDTTAAYTFEKKSHKLLVSLGGPMVSFAVFGLGLWGAAFFAGGGSIWDSVLVLFSVLNIFTLIMNFNPLIKMDAYYMLSDLLEVPNLRARSFRFLNRKLLGWLGVGTDLDTKVSLRESTIFWWYGLSGAVMTLLFAALPFLSLIYLLEIHSDEGSRTLFLILGCSLLLFKLGTVAYGKLRAVFYREYKLK